jgi:cytochrome c
MPAARIWGPNLHGIYGSPMGRNRPAFAYSAALRDANGHWDDATLDAWLRNPQALVPGTYMQFGGISDPLDRGHHRLFAQAEELTDFSKEV